MSRKVKLGWKVVRVCDKKFCSSNISNLEYSFNRWTKPLAGWGPLCVFTDRNYARAFAVEMTLWTSMKCYRTVRCKYFPSEEGAVWDKDKIYVVSVLSLPPGKALASAVKLLKQ